MRSDCAIIFAPTFKIREPSSQGGRDVVELSPAADRDGENGEEEEEEDDHQAHPNPH